MAYVRGLGPSSAHHQKTLYHGATNIKDGDGDYGRELWVQCNVGFTSQILDIPDQSLRKRMYKSRIVTWGLCKYKQRKSVTSGLHLSVRPNPTRMSPVADQDTPLMNDEKDPVPNECNQTSLESAEASMASTSPSTTPTSSLEDSPSVSSEYDKAEMLMLDSPNAVDVLLWSVRNYIVFHFETGAWVMKGGDLRSCNFARTSSKIPAKSDSSDLYTSVRHSRRLFERGNRIGGAGRLRSAFSQIEAILDNDDPYAIWELLNTVSYLRESQWDSVFAAFLTQLARASKGKYSQDHPIAVIFRQIRYVAPEEVFCVIAAMRKCASDLAESFSGLLSVPALNLRLGWLRSLSLIQGRELVEQEFRNLLNQARLQFGKDGLQSLLILNRIANSLQERHSYAAAEAISLEILQCIGDHLPTHAIKKLRGQGLSLISRALIAQGKYDAAEEHLAELLAHNTASYGSNDPLTISAIGLMEVCLTASGKMFML
jgi:tetratricopeptide (TPR) repeat protein